MQTAITHISTACVLLEIGSLRILTDPVFDTGCRTYRFGAPFIKATRFRGPFLDPADLPPLDAILLSHPHHRDNLDQAGMDLLPHARRVITGKHGKHTLQGNAIGLDCWDSTTIFGSRGEQLRITATPALHGPRWLPTTTHVCGFILEWDGQADGAYYISGDTIMFDGIHAIADRFQDIDTAILHLGGVHFWPPWPRRVRYTFTAAEGARAAQMLGAKRVIPIHYEQSIWSHFKEDVTTCHRTFHRHGLAEQVLWLTHGRRTPLT